MATTQAQLAAAWNGTHCETPRVDFANGPVVLAWWDLGAYCGQALVIPDGFERVFEVVVTVERWHRSEREQVCLGTVVTLVSAVQVDAVGKPITVETLTIGYTCSDPHPPVDFGC